MRFTGLPNNWPTPVVLSRRHTNLAMSMEGRGGLGREAGLYLHPGVLYLEKENTFELCDVWTKRQPPR